MNIAKFGSDGKVFVVVAELQPQPGSPAKFGRRAGCDANSKPVELVLALRRFKCIPIDEVRQS